MATMTAERPDVLTAAYSCKDCHIRALQDEIRSLRAQRDSLDQELVCRRRFSHAYTTIPRVRLVEKVSGMDFLHPVGSEQRDIYWSGVDELTVVFRR